MTPLMTVADVCAVARCHRAKVDRATRLYRTSKGRKGLRYQQAGPGAHLLFRPRDVEAWLDADSSPRLLRSTA